MLFLVRMLRAAHWCTRTLLKCFLNSCCRLYSTLQYQASLLGLAGLLYFGSGVFLARYISGVGESISGVSQGISGVVTYFSIVTSTMTSLTNLL